MTWIPFSLSILGMSLHSLWTASRDVNVGEKKVLHEQWGRGMWSVEGPMGTIIDVTDR